LVTLLTGFIRLCSLRFNAVGNKHDSDSDSDDDNDNDGKDGGDDVSGFFALLRAPNNIIVNHIISQKFSVNHVTVNFFGTD